ncbi:lysozyme [Saccharothrix coeruleofusca]|nr:lysozyme [Saccharothrix coeruleofusca]MBP2335423.1 lysozyme [Saccharothrix coeruleofusca]
MLARPGTHPRSARTTAAALVLGCLAAWHVPAAAQPPPEGSDDHYAGSQIAKHEGAEPVNPARVHADVPTVDGIDVSSHQGVVDWPGWWQRGKRFAYVKATEGTGYRNGEFARQYDGAYQVGMVRGAYHFALPDRSDGATQANFFADNGGGWSRDGRTLPGVLDVEYNPYGVDTCYGLSAHAMVAWIRAFSDTYHARTGRWPVIYTSTQWWDHCTGRAGDFSGTNPLWVARYATVVGPLPHRWSFHTIWQFTSSPIDQNKFNGGWDRLVALANG